MARILITGGAGYIGSHTAVELVRAGYEVVLVDDLSNSSMDVVEAVRRAVPDAEVPFVDVDCTDYEAFGRVFERWRFDAAIHFAAFKSVPESVRQPLKYYRNNVGSMVALLGLCPADCGIVFSSSASVYGHPAELPATELTPRAEAASPYGATKQICEDILRDAVFASSPPPTDRSSSPHTPLGGDERLCSAKSKGLRGISLRYFNPVGQALEVLGAASNGAADNIVPIIARIATRAEGAPAELSVFGGDYPTPDGTALRDYLDIVDLARAHVSAVERLLSGGQKTAYEVFNIGTGRAVSVLELVRAFEEATGLSVPFRIAPRRAGDPAELWADVSLAATELGWRATRSLAESLRSVV